MRAPRIRKDLSRAPSLRSWRVPLLTDEVGLIDVDPDGPHGESIDLVPGPRDLIVHPNRLLFPCFVPAGGMALTRPGPAEAVRRLLLQTYNLESLGQQSMDHLARVAESCPTWAMPYEDAVQASALVAAFVLEEGRTG